MDLRIMIIDDDPAYLMDIKEFLDSSGRITADISTMGGAEKRNYDDYDIVLANEKISDFIKNNNVIPIYPEYSTGKGLARYSGKKALIRCIDDNHYRIKGLREGPCVISVFPLGSSGRAAVFLDRFKSEVASQHRNILLVNLSFSIKEKTRQGISSSDLVFYLSSDVEEKQSFISNILKSGKKHLFLGSMNSLREVFEAEDEHPDEIITGIRGIWEYEYVIIVFEPGIRRSIYDFCSRSDLNIFVMDKDTVVVHELLKGMNEGTKVLPLAAAPGEAKETGSDKRIFEPFIYNSRSSFIRRLDGIFGRYDRAGRKNI